MGLTAPWYRRCGTSVESSIPCSHGGRALVAKGAEEVENAKTNSKYQDRADHELLGGMILSMRDKIMQRYDQELLGAPLWCTTQQEEVLWIQGVNAMVPQRRVFVCASELALDESLDHQHRGAVYHRGRSPSTSTSESHGVGRDHVNDQELLGAPLQ
ncbi:hypothetical protein BHE74_00042859 [Ensete ventricosum]|nr:hypothetical protein BHE74_00042859 [Ensete ventricosum]RZS17517.1 hypothetical protein BHM03_00049663 [Ensete ventricosum]